MQDIKAVLELVNSNPSSITKADNLSIASHLLDFIESETKLEESYQVIETLERICKENKEIIDSIPLFSTRLTTVAMNAYSNKNYKIAETAYRTLAETDDTSAKNNYAYMIRRHEITNPTDKDHIAALKMLNDGVKEGEAFSLVNTALVFALMLGDDESWHLADSIFEKISPFGGELVKSWWEDLAKEGESEGFLVMFFLLKHGLIDDCDVGTLKSTAIRLSKKIKNFPKWLAEDYKLETLDDVIDCMEDPDFDSILEDFLEKMPVSRDNTNEMLDTVAVWNLWQVYHKLLTDCVAFLMPDEIERLRADYKAKFSIPLPDEEE